ncbi:hypothetical protein GGS24DRAFT_496113 [Hypoxylon argillaceum]|nr:hypothetical protein GGS24DRAFT_496113 [Hypoxylon argillaceum]KAI1154784.1 hypothetical protein F4825DRAFT_448217 [Nemania diffusa]
MPYMYAKSSAFGLYNVTYSRATYAVFSIRVLPNRMDQGGHPHPSQILEENYLQMPRDMGSKAPSIVRLAPFSFLFLLPVVLVISPSSSSGDRDAKTT